MISMAGFEDPELKKLKEQERLAAEAQAQAQAQAPAPAEPGLLQAPVKPMTPFEQLRDNHGTGGAILRMIGTGLSGGLLGDVLTPETGAAAQAEYATDLDAFKKNQALYDNMQMVQPLISRLQNEDPTDDAFAVYGISQLGGDIGQMFPSMGPSDDTDIMKTTNAYVDSYNDKNKDKEGFVPMTFDEGYDIVKNYDASRRGAQAGAVANASGVAESDIATFNTAQKDYISAFENADVLNSSLANVDRGIEMLATGEVDTGLFNGFIFNTFGIGSAEMGEFNALSKNATIDKLMSFKGPTTDFEFTQSEAAAFADIMKGEDVNEGTLKTARGAIEKAIKRNATLAESAYGTMKDMGGKTGQSGTFDVVNRNYKPWWQQEESSPAQPAQQGGGSGGGATGNYMPEAEALEWLRNNNTPENRRFFAETYGTEAKL